jgi:anti-sigma B factor antagonist
MKLTTETFGNVMVVHTPDELIGENSAGFLEAVQTSIAAGHLKMVLEMDRTEQFDSQGLNMLLDVQDAVREKGGAVKISGLQETGRKIFEVTRLDQRFDLFDSLIDAVSSFK